MAGWYRRRAELARVGGEVRAQLLLFDLARAARAAGLPARAAANIRITARVIGRTKAFEAVGRDLYNALLGLYSTAVSVVTMKTRLVAPLWLQAVLSGLAVAAVLMTKARWSVFGTGLRRLGGTWSVPARAVLAAAALGPRAASPNRRRRAATRKVSSRLRDLERALLARERGVGRPRRHQIRTHRRLVVAALRQAELRLDTQHRNDLLETLLTISTNHTRGHYAALLPAEQLEGLEPAKDHTLLWASLRTGAGVAVVTAAVWAGERFGLSSLVLMLGALAVFSLVFRSHAERVPDAILTRLSG
ncbi:hypothetical protein [Kitasatospora sp. NPDC088351]|uniref:hypothetical protein n=1 Tax=Kitasatospora sp. NPDC088351 TaxID=3155180 RepID=UPI0034491FFF